MDWQRIIDVLEQKFPDRSLSKELGVRTQFVSDLKSGKSKNPGSDFVLKLINQFDINPSWLLGENDGEAMVLAKPNNPVIPTGHHIPLLRQKVSCGPGQPWDAEANIERYVNVFDLIPRLKTGKVYALHVTGSSMLGAGIKDGDIVLFDADKAQDTRDGTYVFSLDGDVYCKRLEFDSLAQIIKVFSVRAAELEKAELVMSFKADDAELSNRLHIFGRVFSWIRPDVWE